MTPEDIRWKEAADYQEQMARNHANGLYAGSMASVGEVAQAATAHALIAISCRLAHIAALLEDKR